MLLSVHMRNRMVDGEHIRRVLPGYHPFLRHTRIKYIWPFTVKLKTN